MRLPLTAACPPQCSERVALLEAGAAQERNALAAAWAASSALCEALEAARAGSASLLASERAAASRLLDAEARAAALEDAARFRGVELEAATLSAGEGEARLAELMRRNGELRARAGGLEAACRLAGEACGQAAPELALLASDFERRLGQVFARALYYFCRLYLHKAPLVEALAVACVPQGRECAAAPPLSLLLSRSRSLSLVLLLSCSLSLSISISLYFYLSLSTARAGAFRELGLVSGAAALSHLISRSLSPSLSLSLYFSLHFSLSRYLSLSLSVLRFSLFLSLPLADSRLAFRPWTRS